AAREDQAAEVPEAAEWTGEGAETPTGGVVETAVPVAETGAVEANFVVTVEADFETKVDGGPATVVESVLPVDQGVTEEDTVENGAPTTAGIDEKGTVEANFAVTVEPVSEAIAEVGSTAEPGSSAGAPPPPPAELSPALKALYAGPLWRS